MNFARAHDQYLTPPDDDPICEDGCGETLVQDLNEDWFCNNKFCPLKFSEGTTEWQMAQMLIEAKDEIETLMARVKRLELHHDKHHKPTA